MASHSRKHKNQVKHLRDELVEELNGRVSSVGYLVGYYGEKENIRWFVTSKNPSLWACNNAIQNNQNNTLPYYTPHQTSVVPMSVTIPPGFLPGQNLTFFANGKNYSSVIPEGSYPGSQMIVYV